jgi:hypothetical protein
VTENKASIFPNGASILLNKAFIFSDGAFIFSNGASVCRSRERVVMKKVTDFTAIHRIFLYLCR